MKRFFCWIFVFALLLPLPAGAEEMWEIYESPYGFSFWYDADLFFLEENGEDGAVRLYPRALCDPSGGEAGPAFVWKDRTQQAVLCISALREPVAPDWTPPPEFAPLDRELDLAPPCYCAAETVEDAILGRCAKDDLFVLLPDAFFTAFVAYPEGDPTGWGERLWSVLETLEFPPQPAQAGAFRLDFFREEGEEASLADVVIDPEAGPIVLLPREEITGVVLETLTWGDDLRPEAAAVFSADQMAPGQGLRIFCYFADVFPVLRVRCVNENGREECWYLAESGRDGSLLLLEAP